MNHVQEGPKCILKEDEFFDAIDQSLDRIDREDENQQKMVNMLCYFTSTMLFIVGDESFILEGHVHKSTRRKENSTSSCLTIIFVFTFRLCR